MRPKRARAAHGGTCDDGSMGEARVSGCSQGVHFVFEFVSVPCAAVEVEVACLPPISGAARAGGKGFAAD